MAKRAALELMLPELALYSLEEMFEMWLCWGAASMMREFT